MGCRSEIAVIAGSAVDVPVIHIEAQGIGTSAWKLEVFVASAQQQSLIDPGAAEGFFRTEPPFVFAISDRHAEGASLEIGCSIFAVTDVQRFNQFVVLIIDLEIYVFVIFRIIDRDFYGTGTCVAVKDPGYRSWLEAGLRQFFRVLQSVAVFETDVGSEELFLFQTVETFDIFGVSAFHARYEGPFLGSEFSQGIVAA